MDERIGPADWKLSGDKLAVQGLGSDIYLVIFVVSLADRFLSVGKRGQF